MKPVISVVLMLLSPAALADIKYTYTGQRPRPRCWWSWPRGMRMLCSAAAVAAVVLLSNAANAGTLVVNGTWGAVGFDASTGNYLGGFGSGYDSGGITIDALGRVTWYSDGSQIVVRRSDFSSATAPFPVNPRLRDMQFGSDGLLYAVKTATSQSSASGVVRYDPATGAYVDLFVNIGGVNSPFPGSLALGPDGHVYVNLITQFVGSEILRFDGATGALIDTFVPMGTGGLVHFYDIDFGPDGNLYATTTGAGAPIGVAKFDGSTGAFLDQVVDFSSFGGTGVTGLTFDSSNHMYVVAGGIVSPGNRDALLKYDLQGQLLSSITSSPFGGLGFLEFTDRVIPAPPGVNGSVPAPATLALLGIGLAGLAARRQPRKSISA